MSSVTVSFLGPMRKPPGLSSRTKVDLPAEATVDELLSQLGYEPAERARFRVMIDGQAAALSGELTEGQELTVFLPLGGG